MGKLTALLYERYKAGKLPLTLQSTDNCSHNGDHVKTGVKAYAERWAQDGIDEAGFLDYINDSSKGDVERICLRFHNVLLRNASHIRVGKRSLRSTLNFDALK